MVFWLNIANSFLKFLTLLKLDFITAHSSLITAKMCSVTSLFLALVWTMTKERRRYSALRLQELSTHSWIDRNFSAAE